MQKDKTINIYNANLSEDLFEKVILSKARINEFNEKNLGKIHCSFSGGKDSSVLLHLCRSVDENIKGVFCNTRMEYPSVIKHVKETSNIITVTSKTYFIDILKKYGYPVVSKKISRMIYDAKNPSKRNENTRILNNTRYFEGVKGKKQNSYYLSDIHRHWIDSDFTLTNKCCIQIKEKPLIDYAKQTGEGVIIGMLSDESRQRKNALKDGCINWKKNTCNPLREWTEQNILEYIFKMKIRIPSDYGILYYSRSKKKYIFTGEQRTGCMGCMFGDVKTVHERFERMKLKYPNHYKAYCGGGEIKDGKLTPKNGFGYEKILNYIKDKY